MEFSARVPFPEHPPCKLWGDWLPPNTCIPPIAPFEGPREEPAPFLSPGRKDKGKGLGLSLM